MSKAIWKFPAPFEESLQIEMPVGAQVLCVNMQYGVPIIWALVDTGAEKSLRTFHWRGTGHSADALGRYVGTVLIDEGRLVFHLFEAVS